MTKISDLIPGIPSLSDEQLQELLDLAHDAEGEIESRKDKKYTSSIENYDAEVKKSYDEGYQTGLNWPDKWKYRPGGPFILTCSHSDKPEFKKKARLSYDKNKAWLSGWDDGKKKQLEDKHGQT